MMEKFDDALSAMEENIIVQLHKIEQQLDYLEQNGPVSRTYLLHSDRSLFRPK